MYRIDLNSDLGESFGRYTLGLDDQIIPLVSSANIACGQHAGDPVVMRKTVGMAKDAGIAIGAGTDVAIDAADVVLMKSRLLDVPAAIRLSRATLRNIHENLFWAFFYNVIGIPLAAGAWIHLLGWEMNPMFGAAAMSLSSFCVVTNALRLNLFRIRSTKHDHKRKNHAKQTVAKTAEDHKENKEETSMEKTMKIEGMMCGHCEARVKKCLEALPGVEKAEVSHVSGTAVLTLSAPVDDALLKKTVEDQGYQVI
jgi:Cu2+-exporting ATPase